MHNFIKNLIIDLVKQHRGKISYRPPLVGFAQAANPGFAWLKEIISPGHLLPRDLLPAARSVVAFFIPFPPELVEIHRSHPYVSREWAEAYIETNRLISNICQTVAEVLGRKGIETTWQQPTHNFDPTALISYWSHKHVAYLCGLGTFGLHHMLITEAGCAGRLGSLVVDVPLPPTPVITRENCLYRRRQVCAACVNSCPTKALTLEGLDKQKCYQHLLEVNNYYHNLELCDVCGKCATGPCALSIPDVPQK